MLLFTVALDINQTAIRNLERHRAASIQRVCFSHSWRTVQRNFMLLASGQIVGQRHGDSHRNVRLRLNGDLFLSRSPQASRLHVTRKPFGRVRVQADAFSNFLTFSRYRSRILLDINFDVQIPPGTPQHQARQRFFHIVERIARVHHARFATTFTVDHLVIDQRFFEICRTLGAACISIIGVAVQELSERFKAQLVILVVFIAIFNFIPQPDRHVLVQTFQIDAAQTLTFATIGTEVKLMLIQTLNVGA